MSKEKQREKIGDFFRRERQRLIAYVKGWIADTAERDGEDIVQDVALNLFDKADLTLPIENLAAYVYQSLRNRAIDLLRKKNRNLISLENTVAKETDLTLSNIIMDSSDQADAAITRKELRRQLYLSIDSLNEPDRAIIIATEFENRSFRELAEQWHAPIGTLLARKSQALKKIRDRMRLDLH